MAASTLGGNGLSMIYAGGRATTLTANAVVAFTTSASPRQRWASPVEEIALE
jgi:hypothetical protein